MVTRLKRLLLCLKCVVKERVGSRRNTLLVNVVQGRLTLMSRMCRWWDPMFGRDLVLWGVM